jgi:hypothetical protein
MSSCGLDECGEKSCERAGYAVAALPGMRRCSCATAAESASCKAARMRADKIALGEKKVVMPSRASGPGKFAGRWSVGKPSCAGDSREDGGASGVSNRVWAAARRARAT